MTTHAEVSALIPDTKISREAESYHDELVVFEVPAHAMVEQPGLGMWHIDTEGRVRALMTTPFDWPEWHANHKGKRVTLA
ncbi:hypothetical protein ACEE90_13085 [Corynebacterium phoceense]|uniref:hypothetical protein n=1 Tax=Corynebacterium phoceense TaxID=1686286 RepID=UPI00211CDB8B|nr:hypothetical protein [Corynebacterium phoceense]MCQ9333463.1 hypothetical protein [Corynebacterium phoceense]MCQ9335898.1 hypothetical protein [Corynebacterium phoceense]